MTRIRQTIHAPRERVYAALTDPAAVARWRVPAAMTSHVHEFDASEGGAIRVSLTYDAPDRTGKTVGRTDTYHGRFVRLVPNELVVEVVEFETDDPALRGEMTITIRLSDADGATRSTKGCRRGSCPPTTRRAGACRSPGSRRSWNKRRPSGVYEVTVGGDPICEPGELQP
jgi:uncharacterized protein YndB with AHSA1/START domain